MTPASNPEIRLAAASDAAAIAAVQVTTWRTTYSGIVPQPYLDAMDIAPAAERFRVHIAEGKAYLFVVTTRSGDVVGFIAGGPMREPISGYDAELYALYLLRGHQRAGSGRALVLHLAAELRSQGYHAMAVWALAQNPAIAFYKRLGAIPITGKMVEIGGARLPDLALGWPDLRRLE